MPALLMIPREDCWLNASFHPLPWASIYVISNHINTCAIHTYTMLYLRHTQSHKHMCHTHIHTALSTSYPITQIHLPYTHTHCFIYVIPNHTNTSAIHSYTLLYLRHTLSHLHTALFTSIFEISLPPRRANSFV